MQRKSAKAAASSAGFTAHSIHTKYGSFQPQQFQSLSKTRRLVSGDKAPERAPSGEIMPRESIKRHEHENVTTFTGEIFGSSFRNNTDVMVSKRSYELFVSPERRESIANSLLVFRPEALVDLSRHQNLSPKIKCNSQDTECLASARQNNEKNVHYSNALTFDSSIVRGNSMRYSVNTGSFDFPVIPSTATLGSGMDQDINNIRHKRSPLSKLNPIRNGFRHSNRNLEDGDPKYGRKKSPETIVSSTLVLKRGSKASKLKCSASNSPILEPITAFVHLENMSKYMLEVQKICRKFFYNLI